MEKGVWKDVFGFCGNYKVSSYGRVKSFMRNTSIIMKPKIDRDGYEEYCLTLNKERFYRRGHRLVGEVFVPNPEGLPVIDHKDNTKRNNYYKNLQWVTTTENTINYFKSYYQDGRTASSLTMEDCEVMLKLYKKGFSYKSIADKLQLTLKRVDYIGEILSGRKLSTISGFTQDMRGRDTNFVLDLEQCVCLIKDRLTYKLTLKDISEKYNVNASMVSRLVSGKRRPEALAKFEESL